MVLLSATFKGGEIKKQDVLYDLLTGGGGATVTRVRGFAFNEAGQNCVHLWTLRIANAVISRSQVNYFIIVKTSSYLEITR